ncbi:hypothetical protein PybrP1_013119 [[Pythium] brassicae (nom. inval.)]|nr:hypothetical protein PybrP1_013119 [[Pythium] brassicae (nom. inval.)]
MVANPRSGGGEQAIAQYLVTKVSWRGSYRRVLAVTPSSVLTFNPETFACTAQWELTEIEAVEVADERDQFVLRLEKARFRLARVRFHCPARAHVLSLVAKLRRHFALQPAAPQLRAEHLQAQWKKYRCIEFFGDGSSQSYYLQVGTSAVVLHDDAGRTMDSFPYTYMKRAASTRSHADGIVLATPYQERLFLCSQRSECLGEIYAAAGAIGATLRWEESPLNVQLLRLRNAQLVDHPAVACFEVLKASADGHYFMEVQLLLQGDALVEVHPKMRTVVARKYAKLLNVIRTEWDDATIGLEFAEGESLVVKLEARDQLVALLLLTCRENGYEHIPLTASEIKKNRVYFPHPVANPGELAGAAMENFFLTRLLQTGAAAAGDAATGGGTGRLLRRQNPLDGSSWLPRKAGLRKRSEAALVGTRDSFETGESMNDSLSTNVAMEEVNANIPLNEATLFCHREVLNGAIEVLAEHLASLVITLRRFVGSVNTEIVTTLQALVRLSYSPHAALPDPLIPRVFDAVHELFLQQDFLACYWSLKLLQCYFDPARAEFVYGERAKILQHVSTHQGLLGSLVALLPSASPASTRSSGFWLMGSNGAVGRLSRHSSADSTLQSKDARLEKEMNIVYYEAVFTLHYIAIYLHEKGRQPTGGGSNSGGALNGQAAQVLREFDSRSARRQVARAAADAVTAGVPATQKRFLADKLVAKHAFLMDAAVDVRLVRTCLSCVALVRFLTLELGKKANATTVAATSADAARISGRRANGVSTSPPPMDESVSRRAVKDLSLSTESESTAQLRYRSSRRGTALRRAARYIDFHFHDIQGPLDEREDSEQLNAAAADELERQLKQMREFLKAHGAKMREHGERSQLFQAQRTIVAPLTGFSQSTDEFAGSEHTQSSDCMKLEHLEVLPAETHDADGADSNISDDDNELNGGIDGEDKSDRDGDNDNDDDDDHDEDEDTGSSVGPQMRDLLRSIHDGSSSASRSSDTLSEYKEPAVQSRPSSNLFRSSTFYFEQQGHESDDSSTAGSYQRQRRLQEQSQSSAAQGKHRRTTSAPNIRTSSPHCDACIGCNDVCANVACFLCSEKKYQLMTTFPDSPVTKREASSSAPQGARGEGDNYVHAERTYSSCELSRHRSLRSCWVVVSGAVYDITDLLSVHPGGLQVLLQAARQGQDCASIMEEHPLSARRVLRNYRLGEYYECETRALPP